MWMILTFIFAGLSLVLLVFLLLNQRRSEDLPGTVQEEVDKPNRRHFFRLEISGVECTLQFLHIADEKLERLVGKTFVGKTKDISASGMQFMAEFDFPIRKKVQLQVDFKLWEEKYSLFGNVVRKEELLQQAGITYGVEFFDLDRAGQERLLASLYNIQLERKKRGVK